MPGTHIERTLTLIVLVIIMVAASPRTSVATPRLPKVFGSHMVVQREKPLVVWGWATPGEKLTVEFGSEKISVQANERGEWKGTLPAMKAGGPFVMTVTGSGTVRFEDVLVGEVWLASGQSNMEMGIGMCRDSKQEIAAADYPNIRLLMIPNRWTPEPQSDLAETSSEVEGVWKVCTPKSVAAGGWNGFSAAAYYFGRELHKKLEVPIGLIDATWGGTRIESWTPPEGFAAVPALARESELVQLGDPRTRLHQQHLEKTLDATTEWLKAARDALTNQKLVPAMPTYPAELLPPHDVQNPTALYNGMIHPLHPFPIRGAIWYQGDSNMGEGMGYTEKMKALIGGWRQMWSEGDFPFYFVQIAPYDYGGNPERVGEFWEGQAAAQEIPNTGMAVINDIGNLKDIHPANKQEVGRRLALWALAKTYDQRGVLYSGPTFKGMTIESDKLRLEFNHVGGGLKSRDGKQLTWFELIDADEGGFVPAEARIDGSSVVLSAASVKHPVAMKFAWSMMAEPNLANSEDLPAGAFRAGKVPKRDLLMMHVPESKDYQLVYDLDLGKLGPNIVYDADAHNRIHSPFDRIAYFVELTGNDGDTQFVYVSMDAFTSDLDKIGIPTVSSGAHFQQNIDHMNVYSNVKGIRTGMNLSGGNIEFWPNNYAPGNKAGVPDASDQTYDFGDDPSGPPDGYGSMQIHNHEAKQTLFAINHWREGKGADLGIGNQGKANPDWTFAANAGSYTFKRLRAFVKLK
jgi:sialate O-acetylesterase